MKSEKIKQLLKSSKVKIAIGVIAGLVVGSSMGGSTDEQLQAVETSKALNEQVSELESKNKELQAKVDEAKPWFEMEEAERKAKEEKAKKESEKAEKEKLEAKSKTFSNGNYISGKDFEAGTYDIVAVSGGGNVSSSNIFDGGINAIMGVANDGFHEKEYKNIELPEGVKLTIDGVKIKLIPKN